MTSSRPAPGDLPPLAGPDIRRDRRPGSRRRDAPQRRPAGTGQPRGPVRRPPRHGQDVARPDPGQGAQLHGPPGRRRLRRCPSCVSIREGATLDLVEIDAASNRGIDAVRDLRERLPYPPGELRRKVYILDEAHQITKDAWNALLKSIEEPPPFVNFMFASTEPSGFPPAILSRLQRYDVRRLTVAEIEGKLRRILDGRRPRTADAAAVHLIARLAAGGMRDAESMLDQLLSAAPDDIDERRVRDLLGLADADAVDAFVDRPRRRRCGRRRSRCSTTLEERGRDARVLLDQAIDAIRARAGRRADGRPAGRDMIAAALADAARRLAAIDPERAGIGGLRLQLELALFTAATASRPRARSRRRRRARDRRPAAAEPTAARRPTAEPASPRRRAAHRRRGHIVDHRRRPRSEPPPTSPPQPRPRSPRRRPNRRPRRPRAARRRAATRPPHPNPAPKPADPRRPTAAAEPGARRTSPTAEPGPPSSSSSARGRRSSTS